MCINQSYCMKLQTEFHHHLENGSRLLFHHPWLMGIMGKKNGKGAFTKCKQRNGNTWRFVKFRIFLRVVGSADAELITKRMAH